MARDMSNIYRFKNDRELRELRSKKLVALDRLRRQHMGYFVKREIDRQSHLLRQIEAELAARRDQLALF